MIDKERLEYLIGVAFDKKACDEGMALAEDHPMAAVRKYNVWIWCQLAEYLQPDEMWTLVKVNPKNAMLYGWNTMTNAMKDYAIQTAAEYAMLWRIGVDRPAFQRIVRSRPKLAVRYVPEMMTPKQFDSAVRRWPILALFGRAKAYMSDEQRRYCEEAIR